MKTLVQEVKDVRLENWLSDSEHSLIDKKILMGFKKDVLTMEEELREIIRNKKASSQECQRLMGSVKIGIENIIQLEKRIPTTTNQTRELLKIFKEKYPEELKRMKMEIENKLIAKGIIGNEEG